MVPTRGWNRITAKALRFAVHLSGDVIAIHLSNLEGDAAKGEAANVRQLWQSHVENRARAAGIPPPRLVIAQSPYREFVEPLLEQIDRIRQQFPDRVVAVIIGEIIEPHWWQGFLHSRRAARLRAVLHSRGDAHIVVMELPGYLNDEPDDQSPRVG